MKIITRPADVKTPEYRNAAVEVEDVELRAEDDKIVFIGYAAVYDRLSGDLGGFKERIASGAFRSILDTNPDVRFLGLNHDPSTVLARTTNSTLELREDPRGLRVYAELAPTTLAKDLRVLIQRGDINAMSFGFAVDEERWEQDVDGNVVRTILSFSAVKDVSPVTFPAYDQTAASVRYFEPVGVEHTVDATEEAALVSLEIASTVIEEDPTASADANAEARSEVKSDREVLKLRIRLLELTAPRVT